MKNKAICIRCGTLKKHPFSRCKSCGYNGGDIFEEKAKSYMLSEEFLRGHKKLENPSEVLSAYAEKIQAGESIPFDARFVKNFIKEQELLGNTPPFQGLKILLFCLCFFLIPIIAVIIWVLF